MFFPAERVRLIASTINRRLSHQRFYALDTPEIIIADSAGFAKTNYEDQVLLILTATKKNRRDGRAHEPLEADITNLFNIKRIKEGIASMD